MTVFKAEKYAFMALGSLLVLTVLIRLPILMEPWGGDQAGFGHVAKGILEGKVPYKDNYDLTSYGVFSPLPSFSNCSARRWPPPISGISLSL